MCYFPRYDAIRNIVFTAFHFFVNFVFFHVTNKEGWGVRDMYDREAYTCNHAKNKYIKH